MRAHLIISIALATGACSNHKEVETAKHSLYDADFAVVYSAALEATRALYPNIEEHPAASTVETAWHQVQYASDNQDAANAVSIGGTSAGSMNGNSPAGAAGGMPTRMAYKRFYIRFEVKVTGGRPWRVKVAGHAASWEPGAAMPTELHGIARPAWLEPRTEALQLAIFNRIKPYAIPMKAEDKAQPEDELPKTDPSQFTEVPTAAAKRLAQLKDAATRRDFALLRPQTADDVKWSLGADPGADVALAMWQADPAPLEQMVAVIGSGCVASEDKKTVTCPKATKPGAYQLVLELRGDSWKLTSFIRNE